MKALHNKYQQKGIFLLVMAFVLALAVLTYLLKQANAEQLQIEQDAKTIQSLNEAKQALIAWAVSHPEHPGQMPFPDRNKDANGLKVIYDGKSDCIPSNYVDPGAKIYGYSVLLGRLPIYGQSDPCIAPQAGLGNEFHDADGNVLWYAVSRNLVHKYEANPVLKDENGNVIKDYPVNPSVIDNPVYPWLKILDANGVELSDRVAAIIISPGKPLLGQSRTPSAGPSAFLDSITIGSKNLSNAIYLSPDQAFVMGQDSQTISQLDTRFVKPYNFNDKLVYITINELIEALNRRASSEASLYLNRYRAKTSQFPYAAPLGSALNAHIAAGTTQSGFIPLDGTDFCKCNSPQSCGCSFSAIKQVSFLRENSSWATSSGLCSISITNSKTCICSGAGQCARGVNQFICNGAGVCEHNLSGSNSYTYTVPSYANITLPAGETGCKDPVKKTIFCNDKAKFRIGLDLPAWFNHSAWADFLYYEWSPTSNLQVGNKTGISAILIATGNAISNPPYASKYIPTPPFVVSTGPQIRPPYNSTPALSDYLDSAENTDGNSIFEATNKQKASNYNDRIFVVAP